MLMPSIFGESLLDRFFDESFGGFYGSTEMMKTDIKDTDNGYELTMNVPGVKEGRRKGRAEGWLPHRECFFEFRQG